MTDDFCNDLTNEERLVFIRQLCKMIKADGVADSAELGLLTSFSAHFGVDKGTVVEIIKSIGNLNIIAEAKKITKRQHALELI